MLVNPSELPQCAIRGLFSRSVCMYVTVDLRCSKKGPCDHKQESKPAVASWPYDSEGTPVEVGQ